MSSNQNRPADPDDDAREEARTRRTAQVRAYLEALPVSELTAYILDLARRFPEVRRDLVTRSVGTIHEAAAQTRAEKMAMAEKEQDWSTLAALSAEAFVAEPDMANLEALLAAAAKAGCGSQVRAAALQFLETGKHAALSASGATPKNLRRSKERAKKRGPRLDVLLELALKEHRPDDVRRWYEQLTRVAPPVAAAFRERVIAFLTTVHG